jgi:hypothetical protein
VSAMNRRLCSQTKAPSGGADGTVTAELAVAFPAVTALLAVLLLAGGIGLDQLRIEEAARSASRAVARGDPEATAAGAARYIAGPAAAVSFGQDGNFVTVRVSAPVTGPLATMVSWQLSASSSARRESWEVATDAFGAAPGGFYPLPVPTGSTGSGGSP